jgi:hypothetical protein
MRHRKGRRQLSVTSVTPAPSDEDDNVLARRVYRAPYLLAGVRVLVVINRRGDRIAEIPLLAGVDEESTWRDLERWLDEIDPLPKKADERPPVIIRALRLVQ